MRQQFHFNKNFGERYAFSMKEISNFYKNTKSLYQGRQIICVLQSYLKK